MTTPAKVYGNDISTNEITASWIYTVIDWLDWKNRPKNEKFVICAVGRDKVYMYLKRMENNANNKKSQRQFSVQNKATGDDLKECNIVYISESEQEYYMNILETINGAKGVITISSIDGFARHGGAIEFVMKKKARLIINMKAVKNAKVKVDDDLYGWVETIN
ncbi:MAG: YfiR family protein [Pseudomonadota bacterium]